MRTCCSGQPVKGRSRLRPGEASSFFVGEEMKRHGVAEIVEWQHQDGYLSAAVMFRNDGTVHAPAQVEVLLSRRWPEVVEEDGRVIPARVEPVGSLALPPSDYPVLPGTVRLFPFLVPVELEPGEYQLAVRVDYGGDAPAGRSSLVSRREAGRGRGDDAALGLDRKASV